MALTPLQIQKVNLDGGDNHGAHLGSAIRTLQDEVDVVEARIGSGVSISTADFDSPIYITYNLVADATLGLDILAANCPFALTIKSVQVECRATVGGGTVTLSNGTADITDAIVCAVDTTKTVAGTIDNLYSTIAAGGTLDVTSANAGDRARITLEVIRN